MTDTMLPLTGTLHWYRDKQWRVVGCIRYAVTYVKLERRDGGGTAEIRSDQWTKLTRPVSAWDALDPKYQSATKGWTTHGEFACYLCGTSIGKNLLGQSPQLLADQHLRDHMKEASCPST